MKQRGRKSTAALTVAAPVDAAQIAAPPDVLSDYEASIWQQVTATKPASWFPADTHPLLVSYCKHIGTAAVLDQELANFDPTWLKTEAGMERYRRLTDMREKQTRAITSLARSMRLTQQARMRPEKAGRNSHKTQAKKPWES